MPSNVFKGQKTVKVAGGTAQVFEARKDGKIVGQVAQIEFQEETYAIAVNSATKQVSGVVRAGSTLEESEWKALPFVESVRQALAGTEAK